MTHFTIPYHDFLMKAQTNYCNNNLLILDVTQLNKIINFNYFITFILSKHCGMTRVILRCIMGCPGLKSSYREKGLLQYLMFSSMKIEEYMESELSGIFRVKLIAKNVSELLLQCDVSF